MLVFKDPAVKYTEKQKFPISFTGEGMCPLKPGDKVEPSTVVFEGSESSILQSIDLTKELALKPSKAEDYLLKSEGEIVDEGDVLAKRTVSMGIVERIVRANYEGRLSYERLDSGIIDIMSPSRDSVVTPGMHGRVAHVMPGDSMRREVILSVSGLICNPAIISGESVSGDLHVLKDGNSMYRAADVDAMCTGKIVVAGRSLNIKLYDALVEAGAAGVIVGGVGLEDFGVIRERVVPVFVMEGWGVIPINTEVINILRKYNDAPVFMDTRESRLFVYPKKDAQKLIELDKDDDFPYAYEGQVGNPVEIVEGDIVQIWDFPYWGYSGEVMDVLEDEELINVAFASGRKALVEPELVRIIGS
jgi:hypothetical protein